MLVEFLITDDLNDDMVNKLEKALQTPHDMLILTVDSNGGFSGAGERMALAIGKATSSLVIVKRAQSAAIWPVLAGTKRIAASNACFMLHHEFIPPDRVARTLVRPEIVNGQWTGKFWANHDQYTTDVIATAAADLVRLHKGMQERRFNYIKMLMEKTSNKIPLHALSDMGYRDVEISASTAADWGILTESPMTNEHLEKLVNGIKSKLGS